MASDIDEAGLSRWMRERFPDHAGALEVSKFPGGQSNPTYRIRTPGATFVLRRKPFGRLLPSAHAIEREFRILRALHPSGFPVPRPLALCEDEGVVGAAFYVMEMVEGRAMWPGTLPDETPFSRRRTYEAAIGTLARLHSIDHVAVGLGDLGRPGGFYARQVARWTRQYRLARTEEIPRVERLIDWLPRSLPRVEGRSITHGDYRLDNLIFADEGGRVAAVIDWELATIGDPLADLGYLLMNWVIPIDGRAGLLGTDFGRTGIPTMEEAIATYCRATGRDKVPDLTWHFAFNLFRLVAIVQGLKRRLIDGNASSGRAEEAVALLPSLVDAAWDQAVRAGAD